MNRLERQLESLKRSRDNARVEYERAKFNPVESSFLQRIVWAYEAGIAAVEVAMEGDRNGN